MTSPIVPRPNNPQSPPPPVVPIPSAPQPQPTPVVPFPEPSYQPETQPSSDLQPYQPYVVMFQQPNQLQEIPLLSISYVKYRGYVYINGDPAPVGTVINTNAGGSCVVSTPGQYSLDSHDVANIEFYVDGMVAFPQQRMATPYERNIDLYAVLSGPPTARRQMYRNRVVKKSKPPKRKKNTPTRRPRNR
jgi:hypothetical protein